MVRPRTPIATFYRAVILSRGKDKKGAAQQIQSLQARFFRDRPEYALQAAQIVLDNNNVDNAASILGTGLSGAPDNLDLRLKLAELRFHQNSPQSALVVLNPVQNSNDPRVQSLLGAIRARIAKDRSF
jgi:predicted Zn-dependent protease